MKTTKYPIELEAAEIFDRYSILELKWRAKESKSGNPQDQDYINYANLFDELCDIFPQKISDILSSDEYKNLLEANKEIYQALCRYEADNSNLQALTDAYNANNKRFEAKRRIQKIFFNSYLSETKTAPQFNKEED